MALTDLKVRTARVPVGKKQIKITDGAGLYLLVRSSGKYWRFDYRFANKRKTLALGIYPKLTLKNARLARDKARMLLNDGVDPSKKKRLEKGVGSLGTFGDLAAEWLKQQSPKWAATTEKQAKARLNMHVLPWVGDMAVNDIEAPDILALLRRLEARGNAETAHRLKTLISRVFRYGIAVGSAKTDPTVGLEGALQKVSVTHRATIVEPRKIGELLRAIWAFEGTFVVQCALKITPYLFLRPGELRQAEWIDIDMVNKQWRVPAATMKMKQAHIVPLARQVIDILTELHPLTGDGRYVFPSSRGKGRPMSENTINASLRRIGYNKEDMCAHGFRAMASTLLHEQGWVSDVIERQLAHAEGNAVKAAYNHARHLPERIKMMQEWADYLDCLRVDCAK